MSDPHTPSASTAVTVPASGVARLGARAAPLVCLLLQPVLQRIVGRTAVDAGADAVYCGFRNATNARNFPGLNFTPEELAEAVAYAHRQGAKVLLALNTYPPAGRTTLWREAAETGAPLAVPARCYHARAHGRTKDNCQFVCEGDADGMPLATRDGRPFLRVNGIQILSESYVCLAGEAGALVRAGVGHLRLMPQAVDMVAVAQAFRDCLDGRKDPAEVETGLADLCPGTRFSNGFYHGVAGYRKIAADAAAMVDR